MGGEIGERDSPISLNAFHLGRVVVSNGQAQGVAAAADTKTGDEVIGTLDVIREGRGEGEGEGVEHADESDDQGLGVHCRYRGNWSRLVIIG